MSVEADNDLSVSVEADNDLSVSVEADNDLNASVMTHSGHIEPSFVAKTQLAHYVLITFRYPWIRFWKLAYGVIITLSPRSIFRTFLKSTKKDVV